MRTYLSLLFVALMFGSIEALRAHRKEGKVSVSRLSVHKTKEGEALDVRDLGSRWDFALPQVTWLNTAGSAAGPVCGGQTLQSFFPPNDDREVGTMVTDSAESPSLLGGRVTFGSELEIKEASGPSWANWGHGYQSTIYYSSENEVRLRVPDNTGYFTLFVMPNGQSEYTFDVATTDGSMYTVEENNVVNGGLYAEGFAFCSDEVDLEYIIVRMTPEFGEPDGFAIGEFAIGTRVPSIWAGGDPHIRGYHGERFDFKGEAGKVFNFLTDKDVQLNALFDHSCTRRSATVIKEMGLMIEDKEITIRTQGVFVDGLVLPAGTHQLEDGLVVTVYPSVLTDVDIANERYSFSISADENRCGDEHLQVKTRVRDAGARPHGLMGQTKKSRAERSVEMMADEPVEGYSRHDGQGQVEGYSGDYYVQDGLFGERFRFNRYGLH